MVAPFDNDHGCSQTISVSIKGKLCENFMIEESVANIPLTEIFQCILPISLEHITETTIYNRVHNAVQMELTEF